LRLKLLTLAVATVAALSLAGQEKKEAAKKAMPMAKGGILHPEMAAGAGTFDKPMGTLGTKSTDPWTATTVAAGVDNKPQAGKPITVVGEIVDFSCYLQLGKHGDKHRSCGQKCIANGQAPGVLTKTGSLYMLIPEEHDPRRDGGVDAKSSASDHMGHIMEVHGTEATVGGYHAIFVQGLTK
jgi:hypothetical protein